MPVLMCFFALLIIVKNLSDLSNDILINVPYTQKICIIKKYCREGIKKCLLIISQNKL